MGENVSAVMKCKAFYNAFNTEAIGNLKDIYHADVVFTDPIHKVGGIDALTHYFDHICQGSNSRFEFIHTIEQSGQAFLKWVMHYSHPRLAGGKNLTLNGGSFLVIDPASQLIIKQEDFYDMGQMIYKHIPVMKWAVNKLNQNLAGPAMPVGDKPSHPSPVAVSEKSARPTGLESNLGRCND